MATSTIVFFPDKLAKKKPSKSFGTGDILIHRRSDR